MLIDPYFDARIADRKRSNERTEEVRFFAERNVAPIERPVTYRALAKVGTR